MFLWLIVIHFSDIHRKEISLKQILEKHFSLEHYHLTTLESMRIFAKYMHLGILRAYFIEKQ